MADPNAPVARIVVPVEGSSSELVVQEWAVELARQLHTELRALHVSVGGAKAAGDIFRYANDLCKRRQVPISTKILEGPDAVSELVQELGPNDLVVVGTRQLGTEYHLGSVTEGLIRYAPCPVQVIRLR
jgi:nucleotide-binding universal stress UspA family protein